MYIFEDGILLNAPIHIIDCFALPIYQCDKFGSPMFNLVMRLRAYLSYHTCTWDLNILETHPEWFKITACSHFHFWWWTLYMTRSVNGDKMYASPVISAWRCVSYMPFMQSLHWNRMNCKNFYEFYLWLPCTFVLGRSKMATYLYMSFNVHPFDVKALFMLPVRSFVTCCGITRCIDDNFKRYIWGKKENIRKNYAG